MAELLECLICGYQTVRCGMTNHLKSKHSAEYSKRQNNSKFMSETGDVLWSLTKSMGQVNNWSKNRTQKPKVKA